MKTTIIILIVLAVVAFGAYFIFSNNNSYQAPKNTIQTAAELQPSAVSDIAVSIKGFAFSPLNLSVKVGTKVTWTNNDSAPHTVTSDSGTLLNSPTLSPGQSYSVTFTTPGTVNYHCTIHPMMRGTVTVTN